MSSIITILLSRLTNAGELCRKVVFIGFLIFQSITVVCYTSLGGLCLEGVLGVLSVASRSLC
jgi:hypothetical protein